MYPVLHTPEVSRHVLLNKTTEKPLKFHKHMLSDAETETLVHRVQLPFYNLIDSTATSTFSSLTIITLHTSHDSMSSAYL